MRNDEDIENAIVLYGDAVLRACLSVLSNHHDAEDAFQETFLRYARCDREFTDENHKKAWLLRTCINLGRDRLRRASMKDVPLDRADQALTADSEADALSRRLSIREAMRRLPPDQRTALLLSVVEGYCAREIAQIMGKPENTVYSLITRGKKKLKEVLSDNDAEQRR